jgi:hypothetical protein
MPVLRNAKREAFARNIARSPKTGWPQSRCYRESGYATSGNSAEVNACRLLRDAQVMNRISEITEPAVRGTRLTLEVLLSELETTLRDARRDKAHGAVVAALGLTLKIHELVNERNAVDHQFAGALDTREIMDLMIEQIGPDDMIEIADQMRQAALDRAAESATPINQIGGSD